jgi:hypothetical protein
MNNAAHIAHLRQCIALAAAGKNRSAVMYLTREIRVVAARLIRTN